MTTRRMVTIALVFAVVVQTGLVVTYHRITDGCFCQVLRAPSLPIPPRFVIEFLEIASLPAVKLPYVNKIDVLGVWGPHSLAGSWAAMLTYAAINAVFLFAGAFALLKGIVLLGRIRSSRRAF